MTTASAMMEQQQTSGLTVREFCTAENISPANFYYWRKRLLLEENPEATRLVPVCIEKPKRQPEPVHGNLELTYPNGVRISVSTKCELNLIRELVLIL